MITGHKSTITYNGEDTAPSTLTNGRADGAEVISAGRDGRRLRSDTKSERIHMTRHDEYGGLIELTYSAIQVRNAQDVGGTALRRPVQSGAGNVCLSVVQLLRWNRYDDAGKRRRDDGRKPHIG